MCCNDDVNGTGIYNIDSHDTEVAQAYNQIHRCIENKSWWFATHKMYRLIFFADSLDAETFE